MGEAETVVCAMCRAKLEAVRVRRRVAVRLREHLWQEVSAYVSGYECGACGDVICAVCKKEYLEGMTAPDSCPRCGNPWDPKDLFIQPYLERANRRLFDDIVMAHTQWNRLPPPTPRSTRPRFGLAIAIACVLILFAVLLFMYLYM